MGDASLAGDDRGASITLNYVLAIAIAALLVTGLLVAGGNFVSSQQSGVVRNELAVVGQRLASDIEHVDRLAVAGAGNTTVRLDQSIPTAAAGSRYDVRLVASQSPELVLESESDDVSVAVPISNRTPVENATVNSGVVTVVYDNSTITITDAT